MLYAGAQYLYPSGAHFATYADLAKTDLIEKGWVPDFLPDDAIEITEYHDLDINQIVINYKYQNGFARQTDALTACLVGAPCHAELEKFRRDKPTATNILILKVKGNWASAVLIIEPEKKLAHYYAHNSP